MQLRAVHALAAAVLVAAVGCSSPAQPGRPAGQDRAPLAVTGSPLAAAAGAIPFGPGPQSTYQVTAQPAPGSCHYRYTSDRQPLPDPACTPGALSPAVTQANIGDAICRSGGYTSTIRPPANITGQEKAANAASYGYTGPMADAEYDHLIPVSSGGDPDDPRNLWVQPPSPGHVPGSGPNNPKGVVEAHLHTAICSGNVKLADAQRAIATDWTTVEATLGIKPTAAADTPSAQASADGDAG